MKIEGLQLPKEGEIPTVDFTIPKERNEILHYQIDDAVWFHENVRMAAGEKFSEGFYELRISLTALNNYVFSFDDGTKLNYTVNGSPALRMQRDGDFSKCDLSLTFHLGGALTSLDSATDQSLFEKENVRNKPYFTVLYDGRENTMVKNVRGTLLEGTVVEGLKVQNGFLTYRFGTETGEISVLDVALLGEEPTKPLYFVSEHGEVIYGASPEFYQVTKDTFINAYNGNELLPVGVLYEGQAFISEKKETKLQKNYYVMQFHGVECYVAEEDVKPVYEASELRPTVTADLTDVSVLEGETATFTFEAEVPLYMDQVIGLSDSSVPRLSEKTMSGASYYFISPIDFTELEAQGLCEVEWVPGTGTLIMKNCSEKLNGLKIKGAVKSYDTTYTGEAVLTVRKEAELPEEDLISEVILTTEEDVPFSLSTLTPDIQVISEGMNRQGELRFLLAPMAGKALAEEVNLSIQTETMQLVKKEMQSYGALELTMEVLDRLGCDATDETKLKLSELTVHAKEGESVNAPMELLNTTEKTPEFSLEGIELPEGLSLDAAGAVVGTAAKGTSGIYFLTVKAKTEPVLITERRTELVWQYAAIPHPEEELIGNTTITQTVTPGELASLKSSGKAQSFTDGFYTYTVSYAGLSPKNVDQWNVTFTSDIYGAGNCTTKLLSDGTLQFTHRGTILKQSVWYETVPVQVEKVIEEEVISSPETTATVTLIIAPEHEHEFAFPEKTFICDLDGESVMTCSCGEQRTIMMQKRAHLFTEYQMAGGSCFDDSEDSNGGLHLVRSCTLCGAVEELNLSEMGHRDLDENGCCDICGEDLRVEKLARITGLSKEDVKAGNLFPEYHIEFPEKKITEEKWFLPAVITGGLVLLAAVIFIIVAAVSKKERKKEK